MNKTNLRLAFLAALAFRILNFCMTPHCAADGAAAISKSASAPSQPATSARALPRAIIYKTRGDYDQLIPVGLSADGKSVVQYSAPADIYYEGKLATPAVLKNYYRLDNRGVAPGTAFLKTTYPEYAALAQAPASAELQNQIADRSPFTEMYDCGFRRGGSAQPDD